MFYIFKFDCDNFTEEEIYTLRIKLFVIRPKESSEKINYKNIPKDTVVIWVDDDNCETISVFDFLIDTVFTDNKAVKKIQKLNLDIPADWKQNDSFLDNLCSLLC